MIWYMNGTTVSHVGIVWNLPVAWLPAGVADFDGDGRDDILWRDSSGNVAIWLTFSNRLSSTISNVSPDWAIVGTRDLNADGRADIIWRDTGGNTSIWFMNGTTLASSSNMGNAGDRMVQ